MKEIPAEVLHVQMCGKYGIPLGHRNYISTVKKYPEYFPKEYAHIIKYEAIPNEVHDEYFKEYWEFTEELWKDAPKSGGLMAMANNTEEYKKWQETYGRLRPFEIAKEKELHKKYYTKYGL